ncbi:MAG: hypothetical protein HGA96_11255 [Desulfobulbaceae bacterium]|nr:hypothetical protein [Desulfobulbaceae bacterium]
MGIPKIVREIIEAHGGAERWRGIAALEVELSARGFLFAMKRVPCLEKVRVEAYCAEPRLLMHDFPVVGQTGEFRGEAEVVIRDVTGAVLAQRSNPREQFGSLRRQFFWDHLDLLYFAAYATWGYLMTPFLFLRAGFRFEEVAADGYAKKLLVTFPADLPNHCHCQEFYFDEQLLLRRLDYTAEVVGGLAKAAHFCDAYQDVDGLKIPTRRWVRPLFIGKTPAPWPTLVAIDIHRLRTVAI